MSEGIHIGDETYIPIFHTSIFGQSGVGKTKLLKYMISQVIDQGFKVLIFDSKIVGAEFEGIGMEIPFYIHESTDPDVVLSLLEGMRPGANLEKFRGGFIEICDGTVTFSDIESRLDAKMKDPKIKGWTKSMYQQIQFDFIKLKKLIAGQRFSNSVDLSASQIVRMPTCRLANVALQGLVVRSVIERLMQDGTERLIFLIDEAPNFAPQRGFNPAKRTLETLDNQGRKNRLFMWCSGQTLTGFDKASLKNMWYWIIGREMELNEAKDAFDTQTTKILNIDQVRTLKVRQFLVCTPEFTKLVEVPYVDEAQLFPQVQEEDSEFWLDASARLARLEVVLG